MTRTTFSSRFHLRSHFIGGSKAPKAPYLHQNFQTHCLAYRWATITPTSQSFHLSCALCPLESRNQGHEANGARTVYLVHSTHIPSVAQPCD